MNGKVDCELPRFRVPRTAGRAEGPGRGPKRRAKKVALRKEFREATVQRKAKRRICKKRPKPFRNLSRILNVIYLRPGRRRRTDFGGNFESDLHVLYLILCKLISDNRGARRLLPGRREGRGAESLLQKLGSHAELLRFFAESKVKIVGDLQGLFQRREFEALKKKYFAGLLNANNSLYLFMGFLVKYIQRARCAAADAAQCILAIKRNFFTAIQLKKQWLKKKCIPANGAFKSDSADKGAAATREAPALDYESVFRALLSGAPRVEALAREVLAKYFGGDAELHSLIASTIGDANEKKLRDIVNLSRSLAVIDSNDEAKVFAILECLLRSNDLLRPVSFVEIKDAFSNVRALLGA